MTSPFCMGAGACARATLARQRAAARQAVVNATLEFIIVGLLNVYCFLTRLAGRLHFTGSPPQWHGSFWLLRLLGGRRAASMGLIGAFVVGLLLSRTVPKK